MEAKVQQLLTYRPSLADLYNNRPTNSSVFLLYQYNRFSCEPIREVRRFYVHVQVGSTRISTNILYSCASALMKLSSWELKPKERILVKEHINGFAYKIKDDVFIEADRVYSLSVRRKKLVLLLIFLCKFLISLRSESYCFAHIKQRKPLQRRFSSVVSLKRRLKRSVKNLKTMMMILFEWVLNKSLKYILRLVYCC